MWTDGKYLDTRKPFNSTSCNTLKGKEKFLNIKHWFSNCFTYNPSSKRHFVCLPGSAEQADVVSYLLSHNASLSPQHGRLWVVDMRPGPLYMYLIRSSGRRRYYSPANMIKMRLETSFLGPGTHSCQAEAAPSPTDLAGLLAKAESNLPGRPGVHWRNFSGKQTSKMHKRRALKMLMTFHPIIMHLI